MRALKITTSLFLVFSVLYALDPPSNVRVRENTDSSAIIDWDFDDSKGDSDGFAVKYIDEHITGANSDTRNWETHTVTTVSQARQLEIHDLNSNKPYSFCVVSVKDKRQSQCSSPVTINRLTAPRRISPKRKQVSEKYIDSSRRNEEYEREEESSFPWWILIPLILLPLLAILGYLLWKKSQKNKTPKTVVTHRRTSYNTTDKHEGEALHHVQTHGVNLNDDKQWEEKRLYIQQQRNANLELEKRNEELGYEIAKARRARLEEEKEVLKLEQSRYNDNLRSQRQHQHDKQFVEYK